MSFHDKCLNLSCYICGDRLELKKKHGWLFNSKELINFIENNFDSIEMEPSKRRNINTQKFRQKWKTIFESPLPDSEEKVFICESKCKSLVCRHTPDKKLIKPISAFHSRAYTEHVKSKNMTNTTIVKYIPILLKHVIHKIIMIQIKNGLIMMFQNLK